MDKPSKCSAVQCYVKKSVVNDHYDMGFSLSRIRFIRRNDGNNELRTNETKIGGPYRWISWLYDKHPIPGPTDWWITHYDLSTRINPSGVSYSVNIPITLMIMANINLVRQPLLLYPDIIIGRCLYRMSRGHVVLIASLVTTGSLSLVRPSYHANDAQAERERERERET